MRIAWIPSYVPTGDKLSSLPCFRLGKKLGERGVKTVLIAPRAYNEVTYEVIDGIEIFRSSDFILPIKLFPYPIPIRLFRKIARVVHDSGIDIINWHGYHYLNAAWLPLVKKRLKLPTVVTVIGFPGINWHYPMAIIDCISKMYTHSLGKVILSSADKVVIDSRANFIGAQKLRLAREKLEYIPWGVDTESFRPMPQMRTEVRSFLGFSESDFVIGYCGRLTPVKGIDTLLEAMKLLLEYDDKARLLIIGGGGEGLGGDIYEKKARALLGDRVVITGWVRQDEIPLRWQAADVAVFPSFADAGPIATMESAACGLPVVASRTGGLQDMIDDGVTGFLIEPGSANELTQKIKLFIENPDLRKEMGTASRNYIIKNFSWDEITDRYLRLYASLMKR